MTHAVVNPTDYAWSPIELQCGHNIILVPTKTGKRMPCAVPNRALAGVIEGAALIWCDSCGWIEVSDEFFDMVKDFHGGVV